MENKIFELIEKMYADLKGDISGIKSEVSSLKENLKRIEDKVDNNHKEVMCKLDNLENKFDDLEPKNATRHSEINLKIDTLSKDIKFIKHKLHETEEDVFDIKDHLKIIK